MILGDLTGKHRGQHLMVDGIDGVLVGVRHWADMIPPHLPITTVEFDGTPDRTFPSDLPCRIESVDQWAALETFGRQACPHCLGEHPGVDCLEPTLLDA